MSAYRAIAVQWGKSSRATNGRPGMRLLPGSDEARALGCICELDGLQGHKALLRLDDDCPVPRYSLHHDRPRTKIPPSGRTRWDRTLWHVHATPL